MGVKINCIFNENNVCKCITKSRKSIFGNIKNIVCVEFVDRKKICLDKEEHYKPNYNLRKE